MQIIHHLQIDLARRMPTPPIGAVQNEINTRAVSVSLLENGAKWEVPEGVTAAVAFQKPDGKKGLYDRLPDGSTATAISGSTVTAILAPQTLTCAGTVLASIVFYDNDMDTLATFPFKIIVEQNPAAGEQLSNNYYALQNLDQVNQAYNELLERVDALEQGGGSDSGQNADRITLKSPDGTVWNITVSNSGVITATKQTSGGESGGGDDSEDTAATLETYTIFVPENVSDEWKVTGNYGELNMSTAEFLELFYDGFVTTMPSGVTVAKTSIGKDESGQYDMWEYDFCPEKYNRTILLSSGMHTYELSASFGLANFIGHLYSDTDNDAFDYIRNNVRIKVIPVVNPWGFNQYPKKYGNVNGVNPNRNFDLDGQWASFPVYTPSQNQWNVKGDYPFSEAESHNLARWAETNWNAEFWIDCHTGEGYDDKDLWLYYSSDSVILDRINAGISTIETWFKKTYGATCATTRTIDNEGSIRLHWAEKIAGIPGFTLEQAPRRTTFGTEYGNDGGDISNYSTNISTFVQEFLLEKYRSTDFVAIQSVSLDDVVIPYGTPSVTITATVTPADTTQGKFEWTSSDETVCKVYGGSEKAVIVRIGTGTATLTCKNRYNNSVIATCTVNATDAETFSITNTLTNVTTSNDPQNIVNGESYTATLTPNDGYEMYSVFVTMGGEDITDSVYSNGVITISAVTDDVVITAIATEIVDADADMLCEIGSIALDGDGADRESTTRLRSIEYYPYAGNSVVSAEIAAISNGVLGVNTARMATNFIPVTAGASITIECLSGYFIKAWFYSTDGTHTNSYLGALNTSTITGTVPSGAAFMRISFKKSDATDFTSDELLSTQISIDGVTHTLQNYRLTIDATECKYRTLLAFYDADKNYIGYNLDTFAKDNKIFGLEVSTAALGSSWLIPTLQQFITLRPDIAYVRYMFSNSDDSAITEPITSIITIDGVKYAIKLA